MKHSDQPSSQRAFTLVELLAVMGIAVILLTLVAPTASSILKGTQTTSSGQELAGALALARQTALAKNRTVEVRFYKFVDPSLGGARSFRAYQLFGYDEKNVTAKPLNKIQRLSTTMIMDPSATYSTLLNTPEKTDWASPADPQVPIPGLAAPGTDYNAFFMRFRPDGSTNLDATQRWFVTLRAQTDVATPPKNFVTLQINPVSGAIKTYHP